jgi:hypothetical protein
VPVLIGPVSRSPLQGTSGASAAGPDPLVEPMTAIDQTSPVPLDRALFLDLENAAGTTVECMRGCLWVTRDGFLEDSTLQPGQSYRVEDATRVVVSAFGPSLARVARPALRVQPGVLDALAAAFDAWGLRPRRRPAPLARTPVV